MGRRNARCAFGGLLLLFVAGCGGGTSTPSAVVQSVLPTAAPTHRPTPSPSPSPAPTSSIGTPPATPTAVPRATATPAQVPSPHPSSTAPALPGPSASPAATSMPSAHPSPTATATAVPTATPAPSPSPTPSATPTPIPGTAIITDTNPASSGVYIGSSCAVPNGGSHCIANFPTWYRHSLSFYVAFTDWYTSLATFLSEQGVSGWQAQNVTPLLTWDPIGVNYSDVLAGKWDAYITASALAVKSFPGTIFLRPFHEFNGDYSPYGLANQGADTQADVNFIAVWQRMVTIFRKQGATNVRWVWCFSNHSVPNDTANPWNNPANAYPGDGYVDWVAFDAFNRADDSNGLVWQTFDQLIAASYTRAIAISPNRPVMIAELGTNEFGDGGSLKAQWIATMLSELPQAYPHLRAIGYFDLTNTTYAYGLQSSQAAETAWLTGLRTVDANGVLNFRGYGAPLDTLTSWQSAASERVRATSIRRH